MTRKVNSSELGCILDSTREVVSVAQGRRIYIEARAQAVCQPGYDWAFNSLGQSPCVLGGSVITPCTGSGLTLGALTNGTQYGTLNTGLVNPCTCNTVKYTLTAVCALCQGRTPGQDSGDRGITTYTAYTTNCANTFQGYPRDIPDGLAIPAYAFVPLGSNDRINVDAIRAAAGGPDSTRVPPSTSTSSTNTQTSSPTPSPTTTSNPPSQTGDANNTQTKSNVGPIIGGVIGALVGGVVITALGFLLWRRRTKNQEITNALPPPTNPGVQYVMAEANTPAYSPPHTPNPIRGPSEDTSFSMGMYGPGSFTAMSQRFGDGSSSRMDAMSDVMSQRTATATISQQGGSDAGLFPRDSKRQPPAYSPDPDRAPLSLHYVP